MTKKSIVNLPPLQLHRFINLIFYLHLIGIVSRARERSGGKWFVTSARHPHERDLETNDVCGSISLWRAEGVGEDNCHPGEGIV